MSEIPSLFANNAPDLFADQTPDLFGESSQETPDLFEEPQLFEEENEDETRYEVVSHALERASDLLLSEDLPYLAAIIDSVNDLYTYGL